MIYPEDSTRLFTALLFITEKHLKHSKCLYKEELLNKQWDMYIVEYYTTVKKE